MINYKKAMVFGTRPSPLKRIKKFEEVENSPNPKFCFHLIGGMDRGYFKLKDPSKLPKYFPKDFRLTVKDGWSDFARKDNIDIEGMKKVYIEESLKVYEDVLNAINEWINEKTINGISPTPRSFKYYLNFVGTKYKSELEARITYNTVETYIHKLSNLGYLFHYTDPVEHYWNKTREEFVKEREKDFMVPYAFIKGEEWNAFGEMGWGGISCNEKDPEVYYKEFWDAFNSLPNNTSIYVFNCFA